MRYEVSYRDAMEEFIAEGRPEELRVLPWHAIFDAFVPRTALGTTTRFVPTVVGIALLGTGTT